MHKIERELIKAAQYKTRQRYSDRQDYLKSLFLATTKMSDGAFDKLSDGAADWVNECVQLHNTKRHADFPDFDEVEASEEVELEEAEAEPDEEADEEPENGDEEEPDEEPDEDEEPEEAAVVREPETEAEPELEVKTTKAPRKAPKSTLTEDVKLDKWGCMEGSKNGEALAMFEKGATSKEVKAKMGGTYYNILTRMVTKGHHIEKNGSVIKLIHKDELLKPSKKAKK